MANKLKLSGAAVLLIIVVPVFMYAGALLIGIQLGRALERRYDSDTFSFSFRGALAYVAEELWDTNNVFGRRRGWNERVARVWLPIPARRVRDESSDNFLDETISSAVEGQYDSSSSNSATTTSPAPPQAQRFDSNQPKHPVTSPSGSADDMALESLEIKTTPSKTKRYLISNDTSPRGLIRVGPWGGSGGQPFYMHGSSVPRLRTIVLHHSTSGIHSMACDYYYASLAAAAAGDDDGIRSDGPWGRSHSFDYTPQPRTEIELSAGEHLTAVEGTTGHFSNVAGAVVTSLAFRTSTGRTYGPYGNTAAATGTTPFSVPVADGARIVGFWGRSGWLLDAIGVYLKPCGSSSSNTPAYNTTRRARRQG